MSLNSFVRRWALGLAIASLALVTTAPGALAAQSAMSALQAPSVAIRGNAPTRAELEALATTTEAAAESINDPATKRKKQLEAASIRERLREGDFQTGDRIVVEILGAEVPLMDTTTVRGDRMIQLQNMQAISVRGILRSELEGHLTTELGRFIKEPKVTASSLIQVVVTGKVNKSGFFWVPSDILLSDALMMAGLASGSDVNRTVVKRAGKDLWPREQVQQALRQGQTIDQLSIRAGDEINVGAEKVRDFKSILIALGSISTLIWTIRRLSGSRSGF